MSGLRVTPVECHGIECQEYQWCSNIDLDCKNCSVICDEKMDSFASVDCQRDCQGYLHDFRYARLDGQNISDVSAELMTRVFTLTVVVAVLGCLFALQFAFVIYHLVSTYRSRSRLQQKRLMLAGGAIEQKIPRESGSGRFLRMISFGQRSSSDNVPMHQIATIQRSSFRRSQLNHTVRPNSLLLNINRSGPSEDSCPADESEAVYENLAFSASTPTPFSMANRPLPHPSFPDTKSTVVVTQPPPPDSDQSSSSTTSQSSVSQIPVSQSHQNRTAAVVATTLSNDSCSYPSQLTVTTLPVRQAAPENSTSTPHLDCHAPI